MRPRPPNDRPYPSAPRVWGTVCAALGAVVLLVALTVLLSLPDELREQRAYLSAAPCRSATEAASEPCLLTLPATIVDIEKRSSRSGASYDLTVAFVSGRMHTVTGFGGTPLVADLRVEDRIELTTFRGQAVELGHDGRTQQAGATPVFGPIGSTAIGSALMTGAGWLLYIGVRTATTARRVTRLRLGAAMVRLLAPVMITLFVPMGAMLFARGAAGAAPVLAVLAAWAAINGATLWAYRHRLRPGSLIREQDLPWTPPQLPHEAASSEDADPPTTPRKQRGRTVARVGLAAPVALLGLVIIRRRRRSR